MIVSKVLSQRKSLLKSHDLTRLDCNFPPSSAAKLVSLHCVPQDQLGSSHYGTARLRDFHFIEFRPADIPVWL